MTVNTYYYYVQYCIAKTNTNTYTNITDENRVRRLRVDGLCLML